MENAKKLVNLLIKKKLTIGSVESLTAGLFASTLASVPGASKTLRGALVTYQSTFKTSLLGIKKEVIDKYGVVSEKIANEMVKSGKKILKSDIVISFTGNAGPTKEKGGAEVGRVYVSMLIKNKIFNFSKVYKCERNALREKLTKDSINILIKNIFVMFRGKSSQ